MKRGLILLTASLVVAWSFAHARSAEADPPEIVVIKPDVQSHLANGGWKYDRYNELQSLDAGKRMTIADLKGPGIIRSIHITRHPPEEAASRIISGLERNVFDIHFPQRFTRTLKLISLLPDRLRFSLLAKLSRNASHTDSSTRTAQSIATTSPQDRQQ